MITIDVNTDEITAALTALANRLGDMTPIMEDIGNELLASTHARFGNLTAPDGTPWASNSPATLARKKGSRPLFGESRTLSTQFSYEAGPNSLIFGSNVKYARMQQFGGTKEQFPHLWGDIPARPFLGISETDETAILDTISDALEAAFGG